MSFISWKLSLLRKKGKKVLLLFIYFILLLINYIQFDNNKDLKQNWMIKSKIFERKANAMPVFK
jgi:hypothetical protein